jgi:transposase-like protein
MFESRFNEPINRPTACPFCQAKRVDTIAKTITATTLWRCRECEKTWTIASRQARKPR